MPASPAAVTREAPVTDKPLAQVLMNKYYDRDVVLSHLYPT